MRGVAMRGCPEGALLAIADASRPVQITPGKA
jgi:hypothetical protein